MVVVFAELTVFFFFSSFVCGVKTLTTFQQFNIDISKDFWKGGGWGGHGWGREQRGLVSERSNYRGWRLRASALQVVFF